MSLSVSRNGPLVEVELRGPHHNAISMAMWRALTEEFTRFASDEKIRCVVISGANGNFAAGADIHEFTELRRDLASVRKYHEDVIAPALAAVARCPHPVIAKIEGFCIGGGLELAACCDMRYASESAQFGVPIARLGFSLAPDEMVALYGLAGPAVTRELLLEARLLDAQEAYSKGLLTSVVSHAELDLAVEAAVGRVTLGAPLAARLNKRLLWVLARQGLTETERAAAFGYAESDDHREGVAAFLAHRTPTFRGS
jgi:enoyl-CoA hydratase/carnithine racemase